MYVGCYDISKSENSSTSASEKRSGTLPERTVIERKGCAVQPGLLGGLGALLIVFVLLCIY
jgi:hypothetical protein